MPLSRALCFALCVLALSACQPHNVTFTLRFEQAATRSSAAVVRVRILEGACDGGELYTSVFPLSDPASATTPPRLPRGTYAFAAEARDASCNVIASTCVVRELPLDTGTLELTLADVSPSPACELAQCVDGQCSDDVPPDAGMPMHPDAGHDSGPTPCTTDDECPGARCRGGMCCGGCFDGASCVAGTDALACGAGGNDCTMCTGADQCLGGTCAPPPPVRIALSAVGSFVEIGGRIYSAGPDGPARGELERTTANVFDRLRASQGFVDVAASQFATCAIDGAGLLYCWGTNAAGQLGVGSTTFTQTATSPQLLGSQHWTDVSAGNNHLCAIRMDGRLFCWGSNSNGQLGVGSGLRTAPTEVSGGGTWRAVAGGDIHTCGIQTSGALFCWGSNDLDRLGVPGAPESAMPIAVGTDTDWIAISAGVEHSCGIRGTGTSGTLYCWGTKDFGRLGDGSTSGTADAPIEIDSAHQYVAVAAGQYHTCALTTDRDVYCWGVGTRGATGLTTSDGGSNTPALAASGFDVVAAGWTHTCAATLTGTMFESMQCWGSNEGGTTGTGTAGTDVHVPTTVMFDPAP